MKRNDFLDYVKGLLILLVTIGHSIQFAVYQELEGFWEDPVFKAIYVFHMPLFMGISGYLACPGIQKLKFGEFALGKMKSYLVPVFAWATTYTLAKCFIEGWPQPAELGAGLLKEFVGIRLWFIWALFCCLILTALIRSVGRWFWVIYVASTPAVLLLPEVGDLILLKFMYPYFQAGYAFAVFGVAGIIRHRAWVLAVAAVVSVLGYSLWTIETYIYNSGMGLSEGNLMNLVVRFVTGFSASVLVVFLFKLLYGASAERLRVWVTAIGKDSIFIYIIQIYVFAIFTRVVSKVYGPIGHFWLGLVVALGFGLAITLACMWAGRTLSKSSILAAVYFGRYPKPAKPEAPTPPEGHP